MSSDRSSKKAEALNVSNEGPSSRQPPVAEERHHVRIVIAAYNEAKSIGAVVASLVPIYPDVVVVDDGSTDDTGVVATSNGASVFRHILNRGQGAALQTGIIAALEDGADYIVTFDADGQHEVDDIARLLAPLVAGEADVCLGSRFLGSAVAMPLLRRWMLRVAVLFTRATTGLPITDAHNGMRAFTRAAAERLDLRQDRMAHASEILDQFASQRLRIREVPVTVRYSAYSLDKGQRTSGAFRVLFDYMIGKWDRR